jgi:Ca-activated chloride channel family protein
MTLFVPFAITFQSPVALLGLLLVPMAMLLLRTFRRRAQKYAVRYPGVSTLRAVIGTTPVWRRHLPAALALLAIAALILALPVQGPGPGPRRRRRVLRRA